MKKIKIVSVVIVVFALIVIVLLNNKSKLKTEARNLNITGYPVNVDTVFSKSISKPYILVGTTKAYNDVFVIAASEGKVTKVYTEVGDYIKRDGVIIKIDDVLQKAFFKTAEVNLEKAKRDYKRFKALYLGHSVSDIQLESARLAYESANANYVVAKRKYTDTKITSPIPGIVTLRNFDVGEFVKKGRVVADVINISKLKIDLAVAEDIVFNLKTGDKVEITTDIYPGITFAGKIRTIGLKGDAAHKYPVQIELKNSKAHPLKAGMFAQTRFKNNSNSKKLLILRKALLGSILDPKVFVVKNNKAELRNIVIGEKYDLYLEVLKGLKVGDIIVINGQNNLKDNYSVKITNE